MSRNWTHRWRAAGTSLLVGLLACSSAQVEGFAAGGSFGAGNAAGTNGGATNAGTNAPGGTGGHAGDGDPNAAEVGGAAPRPMWPTQHADVRRTGANLQELALAPNVVAAGGFGRIDALPVDGDVYAQPLYLTQVNVAGGEHNVVVVATAHNSVYAFDADAGSSQAPLWQRSFGAAVPVADFNNEVEFPLELGIVGTPTVDVDGDSIYFVAASKIAAGADPNLNYVHSLHRITLSTGADYPGSPVVVAGEASGTGFGSRAGTVALLPQVNLQRTGLLLANGQVYFGFGHHGSSDAYHGWLFAYDAQTLQQTGAFVSSPNSAAGGVGQGGQGPARDGSGGVYAVTGNGNASSPAQEPVASLCKFDPGTGLNFVDRYTPSHWAALAAAGADFGSTGVMLVPGRWLAVGGDGAGNLYFANNQNLGGLSGDTSGAVQVVPMGAGTAFYAAPVHYAGALGARAYAWAAGDVLRAWDVSGSNVPSTAIDAGPNLGPTYMPGGMLAVSANGDVDGTGVVWATVALGGSAAATVRQGALLAFDADNLQRQLYDSRTQSGDALGKLAKFNPPTVAGGRVYVGTLDGEVAVYGLRTGR